MKNNPVLLVYSALIMAMLFWGLSFIWSKIVLMHYSPVTTIFMRLTISSIALIAIGKITGRLQKLHRKDLPLLLKLSFWQPFLYFIGENGGLSMVSPTVAAVIIATIPLFTPVAAYVYFGEKVSLRNVLGIFISIVGVVMVIMKDDLSIDVSLGGVLLLFMAVIAAVAYSIVIMKMTSMHYNVFSITTYQNTIGIFMFLPLVLIFDYQDIMAKGIVTETLWPLVQLSVFASSLAFIFFNYGIQKIGVNKANIFSNAIPVFTALFSFLLVGEQLYGVNIIGIVAVVGGLFLSQTGRKKLKE